MTMTETEITETAEAVAWVAMRSHSEGFHQATSLAIQIEPFGQKVEARATALGLYADLTDFENEPFYTPSGVDPAIPENVELLNKALSSLETSFPDGSGEYSEFVSVFGLLVKNLAPAVEGVV